MRKFAAGVVASFLVSFLLMTAATTAFVGTFTASNFKGWLDEHNVYEAVIDNIVKENSDLTIDNNQVTVDQPEVRTAIKQVFTPQLLQKITEQFVDGTNAWLNGEVEKPNFRIDLADTKNSLADRLGETARQRYAGLPACAPGQIPNTSNALAIDCRLPGVSAEPQIQQMISQIKTSQEFLPNTTLTADNLQVTNQDGQPEKSPFDDLQDLPKVYQWLKISPYIFGALSLLAIGGLVLLNPDRRRAIRRIAVSLVVAGVLLLVASWLLGNGFDRANQEVQKKQGTDAAAIQQTLLPVLEDIEGSVTGRLVIFGVIYLVVASSGFTYLYLSRTRGPKAGDKGPEPTKTPA